MTNKTNRLLRENGEVRRQEFDFRPVELWSVSAWYYSDYDSERIFEDEYYTNESDADARKEQLLTHRELYKEWAWADGEKTWGEDRNISVGVWKVKAYDRLPTGGE